MTLSKSMLIIVTSITFVRIIYSQPLSVYLLTGYVKVTGGFFKAKFGE